MHEQTGPIKRGFDEFYGYTRGHSHDQYDADYYIRLPAGRQKEFDPKQDEYYATDVFNDYALEFIRQGQTSDKPWFLFLGHSSPHFPVQAPADRADKYDAIYQRGWDVLREERFARLKKIGLINGDHWTLTPRSLVPVDREDIANGYPGCGSGGGIYLYGDTFSGSGLLRANGGTNSRSGGPAGGGGGGGGRIAVWYRLSTNGWLGTVQVMGGGGAIGAGDGDVGTIVWEFHPPSRGTIYSAR